MTHQTVVRAGVAAVAAVCIAGAGALAVDDNGGSSGAVATVTPAPEPAAANASLVTRATVDHVSDGDTVVTSAGKVRVLAIDTPEVFFHPECGGKGASAKTKSLLHPGDAVRLIRDKGEPDRDKFGRLLRYIHITRPGSDDVGYELVRTGWAEVYEAFPTSRTPVYRRAQDVARRHKRGVWGECGRFES